MARTGPSVLANTESFNAVGLLRSYAPIHTEDVLNVVVDLQYSKYVTKLRRIPGLWRRAT